MTSDTLARASECRRASAPPAQVDEEAKAERIAELLAPCVLDPVRNDPASHMGWGPENADLGEIIRLELERLCQRDEFLGRAISAASSPGAGVSERQALVCALRHTLQREDVPRRTLWTLMERAGKPAQPPDDAALLRPATRGGWRDWGHRVMGGGALLSISVGTVLAAYLLPTDVEVLLLKCFAIVVLAALPGWLFLRFIVFRAGTIWTEYVLNLHRLGVDGHENLPEPPATSGYHRLWYNGGGALLRGTPNVYRQKFETYYGKAVASLTAGAERALLSDRTLVPVFLITAVFAVGWATVLWRDAILTPIAQPQLIDLLRFGFLGAYSFVLQMMMRRYFQSDLKASAYLGGLVRVVSVLILVSVLYWAGPFRDGLSTGWQCGLAFFIGFFPLVGMQLLQKGLTVQLRRWLPTLENPYPLSDLVGLNVWYEARLLEEGIEDMENLVTANLVDVLLHTRVPVGRLVDWIDQAHLYLALELPPTKQEARALRKARKGVYKKIARGELPTSAISECRNSTIHQRQRLRRLGIRTATDFESAFRSPEDLRRRALSTSVLAVRNEEFVSKLREVLNDSGPCGPNVAEAILKVFCNSPVLIHVRHWRDMLLKEQHEEKSHCDLASGAVNGNAPLVAQGAS